MPDIFSPAIEIVSYRNCRIGVRPTPVDWVATVCLFDGRRTLLAADGRHQALARARAWIVAQLSHCREIEHVK